MINVFGFKFRTSRKVCVFFGFVIVLCGYDVYCGLEGKCSYYKYMLYVIVK